MKKQNSSPRVFSFFLIISKLLKFIFFLEKTFSVAFFCAYMICSNDLFFKYFFVVKIELLLIFRDEEFLTKKKVKKLFLNPSRNNCITL